MREAAEGISLGDLAFRWSLSKASVHRHVTNHIPREKGEKRTNSLGNKGPRIKAAPTSRNAEDGRCSSCGQVTGDGEALEPKALVRRAERLLNLAEGIALRAEADNDNRLCLMSLDRAQRSLDSLLKVAGLIGADVQVNIDAREQNAFIDWKTDDLKALDLFYKTIQGGGSIQDAISAVVALDQPALPA